MLRLNPARAPVPVICIIKVDRLHDCSPVDGAPCEQSTPGIGGGNEQTPWLDGHRKFPSTAGIWIVLPGGRPLMIIKSDWLAYAQLDAGRSAVPEPLSGATHVPIPDGTQLSVVHALPSSQLWGVYTHPVAGLHASSVHTFPSLHTCAVWTHPLDGSHASSVHTFPSSHEIGV
jgi:hypothetical protein